MHLARLFAALGLGCSASAAGRAGPGARAVAGRVPGARRERGRADVQPHSARREGFTRHSLGRRAAGAAQALAVALAASLLGTGGEAHAHGSNNPPTVANEIPNQVAHPGTAFSYQFPTTTFSDADNHSLTYTATQSGGTALPSWLDFTGTARTFSGTSQATDMGTVSVRVTADDGNGGTLAPEIEEAVVALAIEQSAWSRVRVSNALRSRGHSVSLAGVRCVWQRHDLDNMNR